MTSQFRTALRLDHRAIDAQVKTYKMESCLPWQIRVRDQIIEVKGHNYLSLLLRQRVLVTRSSYLS